MAYLLVGKVLNSVIPIYSLINVPLCPFFLLLLHSRCQCFGEINIDMGPPILVMIALRAF